MTARRHIALFGATFGLMLGSRPRRPRSPPTTASMPGPSTAAGTYASNIVSISGSAPSHPSRPGAPRPTSPQRRLRPDLRCRRGLVQRRWLCLRANGVAEARDHWSTARRHLRTAGPGTPVTLRLGVALDADVNTTNFGKGLRTGSHWHGARCRLAGWRGHQRRGRRRPCGHLRLPYHVGAHLGFVGQLKTGPGQRATTVEWARPAATADALHHRKHDAVAPATKAAAVPAPAVPSSPVPEPHTWELMLGGVAVLGAWRRRRGYA